MINDLNLTKLVAVKKIQCYVGIMRKVLKILLKFDLFNGPVGFVDHLTRDRLSAPTRTECAR